MKINKSPWIHQLDPERKPIPLDKDIDTDIAIVGAGIAGISTAFFILKYTNKKVVVLDQGKLAHGATGHNAGQVVARFERPISDIENEFGFEMTKDALHLMENSWSLFEEIFNDSKIDISLSKVTGSRGYTSLYQVLIALKDREVEIRSGITVGDFFISDNAPFVKSIPNIFSSLYKVVPQQVILNMLETSDKSYYSVATDKVACVNSALLCQEVVGYLSNKYKDRFNIYENTSIKKVVLKKDKAILDAIKHTVNAERVVLCTNGFEKLEIFNEHGLEIDKKFHHLVGGVVGYMSGYLENMNKKPTALAYFSDDSDPNENDPFYYLTRRVHDLNDQKHNLVCVGGPELPIEDREDYLFDYDYPEKVHQDIDNFIKKTYEIDPNKKIDYQFTWHGLMGYTPNRIRLIGEEPKNRVLLYNLGCNGIGIIPSVLGGRRISKIIAGDKVRPSIFDPK
jgi:glycine/D-amino acid oxidase-like deaminating enzyme